MNTIYTDAPEVRAIAAIAFPGYSGKRFRVEPLSGNMRLDSYWSGGSRDYYCLVNMETRQTIPIPENGTPFSNGGQIFTLDNLPLNIALCEHSIFCGKDVGVKIYVHPDNLNRFALAAPVDLTLAEKIVLAYTRERKSSYNGQNRAQMALADSGLPLADWETAKAACIGKGLLKGNGAITDAGRNAIGSVQTLNLKVPGFNPYAFTGTLPNGDHCHVFGNGVEA